MMRLPRLVLHEGAGFMRGLLEQSITRTPPLVGLSIDAMGDYEFSVHEGEEVAAVTVLSGPASLDIVSRPAAGGEIVRLAASIHKEKHMEPPVEPVIKPAPTPPPVDEDAMEIRILASMEAKREAKRKVDQDATDKIGIKITESASGVRGGLVFPQSNES